ncbi:unnamed protein product [Closterium sp. Naga37s-1]|nr:unnamed protein product [Closterium sp. Naga37s-1]
MGMLLAPRADMILSSDPAERGAKLQFAAPDYRPPAGRSRRRSFNEPSFESWRISRPISDSSACPAEPAASDPSPHAPSALSSPSASGSSSPVAVPPASSRSSSSRKSPPSAAVAFPTSLSSPVGSPQFTSFLSPRSTPPFLLDHSDSLSVPRRPSRSIDVTVTDGASRSSYEIFGSIAADPLSPTFAISASPPCPSSPSYHCVFPSPPPSPPSEQHLSPFLFENPQNPTTSPSLEPHPSSPSLEPYQTSPFRSTPQSPHGRGIRSLGSSPRGSSALTPESERLGGSCRWTGGPSNPTLSSASPAGVPSAYARSRRSTRHLPPLAQDPASAASSFAVVTATAALAEARRLKRASSSSSGLEGKGGFSFHHPAATPSPPHAAPSQRLSSTHPRFHRRHGSASSSSGSGLLPAFGLPTPPRDSASRPAAVVTAAADSAEPPSPESPPTPSASSRGYSPRSALSSFGAKPILTRRSGSGGNDGSINSSRGIMSSGAILAFDPLDEASSPPNALCGNGALSLFDAPLAQTVAGGTSHAVSHFPVDRGSGAMRVGQGEDSILATEESERRGAIETRYRNALNEPLGTGSGGEARKNRFLGGPRKSRTFDLLPQGAGEESSGGVPGDSGATGLGSGGDAKQRTDGHARATATRAVNGGVECFKRFDGSRERVMGGAGACDAAGAAADRNGRQARGAGLLLRRVESADHHSQHPWQQQQVYGSGHDAAAEAGGERGRRLLKAASSRHLDPAPSLASPALLTPRERRQLLKSGSGRWGRQGGSGSTSRGGSGSSSGRKGEGEEADDERSREIPLLSSPEALRACVPTSAHSPRAFRRPPPSSPPRALRKALELPSPLHALAAYRHALELPPSPPPAPAPHRHALKLSLAFLDALDSPPAADVALGGGGSSSSRKGHAATAHVQCHGDADSDVGGARTGQVAFQVGGRLSGRVGGSMTDMYAHMERVGVAPEREVRGEQATQEPRLQQWEQQQQWQQRQQRQQQQQRSLVGDSTTFLRHPSHAQELDATSAHRRRSMGGAADVENASRRGGVYQEQGGDYNESQDAWEQRAMHGSTGTGLGIGGARNGRKWDVEEDEEEEGDEEGEGGEEGGWRGGGSWSGLAGAEGGGAEKEWRVRLARGVTATTAAAARAAAAAAAAAGDAAAGGTGGSGFAAAAAAAGDGGNAGSSGGGAAEADGDGDGSFRECVLGMPYEALQRRYHVVRGRIGEGMFGRIHTCVERCSRRAYACKSISKKKLQCVEDAADVRQEVVMLHMLKGHPHIIGLEEVLEDPKSIHLIMDLCSGGDLFDAVKARKHLPEPLAARLLQQLVGALLHCHSTGIVHRDIKPENILLVSSSTAAARGTGSMGSSAMGAAIGKGSGAQLCDGAVGDRLGGAAVGSGAGSFLDGGECNLHIKLIDFGVAAFLDHDGMCRHTAGTTEYMAPEVLSGGRYSPQVDVWSAGVVLFVMLSGVLPFWPSRREGRSTEDAVLRQPLRFGHFRWAAVSGAARDLVARMLTRDPDKRISAAHVLGE